MTKIIIKPLKPTTIPKLTQLPPPETWDTPPPHTEAHVNLLINLNRIAAHNVQALVTALETAETNKELEIVNDLSELLDTHLESQVRLTAAQSALAPFPSASTIPASGIIPSTY